MLAGSGASAVSSALSAYDGRAMPYKLSGNSVVRSDTGEVVKAHSSRERALAHLRALKANVEEGEAQPAVLGALLEGVALREEALTAKKRERLPKSAFAIPESESYPIHNEEHARNALSRVAQHGSPEEKKRVRAAVKRRYPGIGGG